MPVSAFAALLMYYLSEVTAGLDVIQQYVYR